MKYIVIIILVLTLFSCENERNSDMDELIKEYRLPDSSNYKYKMLENDLLRIIRFFPGTKDTSAIYFLNKKNLRDSTAYYFYKNGMLETTIKYEYNLKIKKITGYYENGNIKKQRTYYNNDKYVVGDDKWFYENGKPQVIKEYLLYKDSIQYLNNERYFDETGEYIRDSTFFFEIVTNSDTVSINDSLKVRFNIILPEKPKAFSFQGSINEHFEEELPPASVIIRDSIFYFKPKKLGKDLVEVVFVIVFDTTDYNSPYSKVFLKKEVYVTE